MLDKMKELMEMKKQADAIKKELDALTTEAEDVRGIKITISGSQEIRAVEIDESLLDAGNKQRFEQDLLKAINGAVKKAQALAAQKMKGMMPGF